MNCDLHVKTERTSLRTLQWNRTSNWRKQYEEKYEANRNKKQTGNNLVLSYRY